MTRRIGDQTAGPKRLKDLGKPPKGAAAVVVGEARRRQGNGDGKKHDRVDSPVSSPDQQADTADTGASMPHQKADWRLLELADAARNLAEAIGAKASSPSQRGALHEQASELADALYQLGHGNRSPWLFLGQVARDLSRADSGAEVHQVTEQLLRWSSERLYEAAVEEPVLDLSETRGIEAATVGSADDPKFQRQVEQEGVGVSLGDFSRRDGYRIFLRLNPDASGESRPIEMKVIDLDNRRKGQQSGSG
jgi:hypothetical protein